MIAFIGSVFSPYYAAARRLGRGDPENFCAVNVAVYEPARKYWALTERTRHDLARGPTTLAIGPSRLTCGADELVIDVDEVTVPVPHRIRGRIRVAYSPIETAVMKLDANGRHRWRPIAPYARVTVELEKPRINWEGSGYLDMNAGDEPLEDAFVRWDWARTHTPSGTTILYDVTRRDGSTASLAKTFGLAGAATVAELPETAVLPLTHWRVERGIRCDAGQRPRVVKTLEDTPFYARSLVETHLGGQPVTALHESLSLDRVANPVVRFMLPFRMPRRRFRDTSSVRQA